MTPTITTAIIIFVFGFIYGLLYISQLLSVWEVVVHDVIVAKNELAKQVGLLTKPTTIAQII